MTAIDPTSSTSPLEAAWRRWFIFAIGCSLFFFSQFFRATNAVIAPELMRDLSLDTNDLGLLSASFFYAFALTQIPIGILLDRVGPRKIVTVLSFIGLAGAFLFSISHSLLSGILGRVLLGVGMACNLMGTFKLLTLWFPPRTFALLAGIAFSIGTAGNMFATTPFVFLVQQMGWRGSIQFIAWINLLLVLIFWWGVRDRPRTSEAASRAGARAARSSTFANIRLLLGMKDFWIISFGTLVSYGVYSALQTLWAGPFLMESLGLSAVAAGNILFLLNLGVVAGAPSIGFFSDKLFRSRKWPIFAAHLILCILMIRIAFLPVCASITLVSVLFLFFGYFRGSGQLMYAHIKERVPLEMAGTAMSGINFFTMMGSAAFLQGMGSLMQALYPAASRGIEAFHMALLLCAISLGAVFVSYFFTKDTLR